MGASETLCGMGLMECGVVWRCLLWMCWSVVRRYGLWCGYGGVSCDVV